MYSYCTNSTVKVRFILELVAADKARIQSESAAAIADRIKPLPSTDGLDDEQLKQLARELHAAIDKVQSDTIEPSYPCLGRRTALRCHLQGREVKEGN